MSTAYLLLTKYATPSGQVSDWKIHGTVEAAEAELARIVEQTRSYASIPVLIGPMLLEHSILKVEKVGQL